MYAWHLDLCIACAGLLSECTRNVRTSLAKSKQPRLGRPKTATRVLDLLQK